jgi:hypothetical protein
MKQQPKPKVRKTMEALAVLADARFAGHVQIRKGPDGWNVYFAAPTALQSDRGDAPLASFTAAANRAMVRVGHDPVGSDGKK